MCCCHIDLIGLPGTSSLLNTVLHSFDCIFWQFWHPREHWQTGAGKGGKTERLRDAGSSDGDALVCFRPEALIRVKISRVILFGFRVKGAKPAGSAGIKMSVVGLRKECVDLPRAARTWLVWSFRS